MKENKEFKINKPVFQGEKGNSKFSTYIDGLDKGKLVLGVGALVMCGGYLYPTVFTATNIVIATGSLVKLGYGCLGAVAGALAVDIGMEQMKNRKDKKIEELNEELNEEE